MIEKQIERINQSCKNIDAIFHKAAVSFGMSDSALWIFYDILMADGEVTQQQLTQDWFFSKQTLNSTIQNLCKQGFIELQQIQGTRNKKKVCLTKVGEDYVQNNVVKLILAERKAYEKIAQERLELYLSVMEEGTNYLKETFEKELYQKQEKEDGEE